MCLAVWSECVCDGIIKYFYLFDCNFLFEVQFCMKVSTFVVVPGAPTIYTTNQNPKMLCRVKSKEK